VDEAIRAGFVGSATPHFESDGFKKESCCGRAGRC
jgi:hypothetical protein